MIDTSAGLDGLEEGLRSQDDPDAIAAQAVAASRTEDWARSEHLWRAVVRGSPDNPRAILAVAEMMLHQQRSAAAEEWLAAALVRVTDHQRMAEKHAHLVEARGDRLAARQCWADIARRFPGSVAAWIGLGNAHIALGDHAAAAAAAAEAANRFPDDDKIVGLNARVAEDALDWPEAERLWDRARRMEPNSTGYWRWQAIALVRQERRAEAATLLRRATQQFPGHREIARQRAELLSEMGEWLEAAELWNELLAASPRHRYTQERAFEANWRALGVSDMAPKPAAMVNAPADDPRHVLTRFEPLGNDSEFSIVQRYFGAEQPSLLRWAEIATDRLAAAIDAGLDGLGEPEHTDIVLGSDFKVRDTRFGFASHTWVTEYETDAATFFKKQCQRLRYLARSIIEDIEEGQKIFLYKATRDEPLEEVKRLHAAIRKLGPATLLYVRKTDAGHRRSRIETVEDGLLFGYLDDIHPPPRFDYVCWLAFCRKAVALIDGVNEDALAGVSPADIMLRFESLGDNCEFGYVQRLAGAEPLGLFRWAGTTLPTVSEALERNLAGIGDPAHTEVYTDLDYNAVDRRYGLTMRTFAEAGNSRRETVTDEQCRRMRHLRRQLLSDLRVGDKIFVHKTAHPPEIADVQALHSAIRRHGPGTLLHVRPVLPGMPSGTVEVVAPGLLVGYMDRLVAIGAGWDTAHEAWLDLCRQALKVLQEHP